MNFIKSTSLAAVSIIATLAVASIFGLQLSTITAEEDEDKGYKFSEGVSISGYFKFKQGDELVKFEVFNQEKGWKKADPYVFEVQKIVGETPLLHKHADLSQKYRNSVEQKQKDFAEFDVDIILSSDSTTRRVFDYNGCFINSYFVKTDFDKEEGWMGKGFAVKDIFEIQCQSYEPINPTMEKIQLSYEKAKSKSSLAYKEEQRNLFGN